MKKRDEKAGGVFPSRRVFAFPFTGVCRARSFTPAGTRRADSGFVLTAFLLGALFVSCASAPKASFSGGEANRELTLLPAGAQVYIWADAVKGRPLLDALSFEDFSGKDATAVLDRTHALAAAIFPKGGARRFFLAASGSYPRGRANLSFMFSRDWRKKKSASGSSYWHSAKNNIALALGSDLALVSDIDPFIDIDPSIEASIEPNIGPFVDSAQGFTAAIPPQGFSAFSRGLPLAGWMRDPAPAVNGLLSAIGVPLKMPMEELFFAAVRLPQNQTGENQAGADTRGAESWELIFRVKTPSPSQARSLLTLFSLAKAIVTRGADLTSPFGPVPGPAGDSLSVNPRDAAALLFANVPEQDGNVLTLKTAPVDENRIALLFRAFSVYSN